MSALTPSAPLCVSYLLLCNKPPQTLVTCVVTVFTVLYGLGGFLLVLPQLIHVAVEAGSLPETGSEPEFTKLYLYILDWP